ncbi:MAG: hypothetical protein HFE32_00430 [Clostridia bacterium]|jgi:hypothetical protein|nr:hypothetical protein [Clostridia bacterium]
MDKIKIQVMYNGNFFEFNEGLKAYLFHLGIRNAHDKKHGIKALLYYIDLVCSCIHTDINSTIIEDLAEFVSSHWRTVRNMERYELLNYYYDHKN